LRAKDLYEIEVMSYFEYQARLYAFRLSEVDKEYDMHLQAYLNNLVTATDKGKPKFKDFKDFFDYEKQINEIENGLTERKIKPQHKRMANIAAEVNARGG